MRNARTPVFSIFASYRREDDVGHVGRAIDHVRRHFRAGQIFQDVQLPPGAPLETLIQSVRASGLLLVFIGPYWAFGPDGSPRFTDPADWVRREIAEALANRIPLLPTRLPNARIPPVSTLPPEIQPVLKVNAARLDADDWPYFISKLTTAIEACVAPQLPRNDQLVTFWWGRVALGRAEASQLLQTAITSSLHVRSLNADGPTSPPYPQPGWSQLTAMVSPDDRHTDRITAMVYPTAPRHLTRGFSKVPGVREAKLAGYLRNGPMYLTVASAPAAMWEGWEARNRYNVGAVVATLAQLAAARGITLEHELRSPLGPARYAFEPL